LKNCWHIDARTQAAEIFQLDQELKERAATMHRKVIVASLTALFLAASVLAFGASGDKAGAKGMIISRNGETLIVRGAEGKVTVVLTDDTTTKDQRLLDDPLRQSGRNHNVECRTMPHRVFRALLSLPSTPFCSA
jgi:hypothetical protein